MPITSEDLKRLERLVGALLEELQARRAEVELEEQQTVSGIGAPARLTRLR